MEIGDILSIIFVIICIILIIGTIVYCIWSVVYPVVNGNKIAIDTKQTFKRAIIYMNGEQIELKVKKWDDYEGEQIQIITEDDKVYLVSSFNTILINE